MATRPLSQINVTPLIDVMLVLLIVFMVVTPVAPHRLDAALPVPGPPGGGVQTKALFVEVREAGLTLNDAPVADLPALVARAEAALSAAPDTPAFVRGERIPYREVVRVLDALEGAGVRRIGIVTGQDPRAPARPRE